MDKCLTEEQDCCEPNMIRKRGAIEYSHLLLVWFVLEPNISRLRLFQSR